MGRWILPKFGLSSGAVPLGSSILGLRMRGGDLRGVDGAVTWS